MSRSFWRMAFPVVGIVASLVGLAFSLAMSDWLSAFTNVVLLATNGMLLLIAWWEVSG